MKNAVLSVLFVSFFLVGCGNASQPPQAFITVGSEQIPTVVNGYQWSDGNHSSVADAASDPAQNLHKYTLSVGEKATLSFDQKPTSIHLTMWSNGTQVSKSSLNGLSFALPERPGDYTYEITGQWGNDYVNYDFEVQVH